MSPTNATGTSVITAVAAAISAIIAAISLWNSWRLQKQLKIAEMRRNTINAYSNLQNEVLDELVALTEETSKKIVRKHKFLKCDCEYRKYRTLLSRLEYFSVGVFKDVYDIETVDEIAGQYLINLYQRVRPIIASAYSDNIDRKHFSNFTNLCQELLRMHQKDETRLTVDNTFTQIGNVVTYGHYEQDNNTSNGAESIEWIVLDYDASKNQALLISKYGLDAKAYHNKTPYPTWEKSDIRAWLNETFLNAAFTAAEQKGIVKVRISTLDYSGYDGGNDTDDMIWLLSREEATEYLVSDSARQAIPTKYAIVNGAWQSSSKLDGVGCCWWWLRSPGYSSGSASRVGSDGSLDCHYVLDTCGAARPAFWLNLDTADIYK